MRPLSPALACAALLLVLVPAHAAEPDEAAARLKALLEAQGATFAWTSVSGDAERATIEGATLIPPSSDEAVDLGTIRMTGLDEASNGALRIGTLATPGYTYSQRGMTFEAGGLEVGGLVLPPAAEAAGSAVPLQFEAAHMAHLKVSMRKKELFSAANITYRLTMPETDGDAISVTADAQSFRAAGLRERSPVVDDIATIMGIDALAGSFTAHGRWHPGEGDVELEDAVMLLDGSGKLSLAFSGSGYTSDVIRSGQAMSLSFGSTSAEPSIEGLMAQGMALFGVVSQITFEGASMRFEPAPGVAPDPEAAKEARDRIARDLAPFGKEFAARSLAEIDKYLAEPRSLEVRADPDAPVGAATLMLGLMAAPRQLPGQLGLEIRAND